MQESCYLNSKWDHNSFCCICAEARCLGLGCPRSSGWKNTGSTVFSTDCMEDCHQSFVSNKTLLDKRSCPENNHSRHCCHVLGSLMACCNLTIWIQGHMERKASSVLFNGYLRCFGDFFSHLFYFMSSSVNFAKAGT